MLTFRGFNFRGLEYDIVICMTKPGAGIYPHGPHTLSEIAAIFDRIPSIIRSIANAN